MSSGNPSARPPQRQFTITGPEHWASYLVNRDPSGRTAEEQAQADAWLKREGVRILDVLRDENGEPCTARFTWSYWLHAPETGARGGSVIDYIAEVLPQGGMPARPARPVARLFQALHRMHLSAAQCEQIIALARDSAVHGFPNAAAHGMARDILRAAFQNRHRTRGWENEKRTVLTPRHDDRS